MVTEPRPATFFRLHFSFSTSWYVLDECHVDVICPGRHHDPAAICRWPRRERAASASWTKANRRNLNMLLGTFRSSRRLMVLWPHFQLETSIYSFLCHFILACASVLTVWMKVFQTLLILMSSTLSPSYSSDLTPDQRPVTLKTITC